MNHYNVPRQLAAGVLVALLAGCALFHKKPVPEPAPVPTPTVATVAAPAPATQAPVMQATAPLRYTVKKGDTLWGISSLYLKDAWRWPDIWYANQQIKNPHLIYPGDVLILGVNAQGQPSLSVERNGQVVTETTPTPAAASAPKAVPTAPASSLPITKLEPQARYLPLNQAVAPIPLEGIRPFLDKTRIISSGELDDAGYLLTAFNQSPASGGGDEVYARGLKAENGTRYDIYRIGEKYKDPETGSTLGYEATYIGNAAVEAWTDPEKLMLSETVQEARAGDRFLPVSGGAAIDLGFYPHPPAKTQQGQIVAVLGGVGDIGQYDVIVLNRGSDQGVDPGTVLGIYRKGADAKDPTSVFGINVTLPTERSGILMVFRSFKNASYALVMQASHEIHVQDIVANP